MIYTIMLILFMITFIAWLVWFIGYPVCKKIIKKSRFDWCWYAIWLNVGALIINICNLVMKFTK